MSFAVESWTTKPLGELIEVQNGFAFNAELFTKTEGMPLIRIRDLKNGVATEGFYTGNYDERFVVKNDDLLIGMDGEFRCYKWQGSNALLNQRVCRLQSFADELLPDFVFYGINKHLRQIEDNTSYSTVKHISSKQIKEISFSFPPLKEQRRIVGRIKECLSRVDEIKRLRNEIGQEASHLISAAIEGFFEDVNGEEVELGDVVTIESVLVDPRKSDYLDLLHVGGANIVSGTGEIINLKTAREEKLISSKFIFDSSNVVYSKIRPYLRKVIRPDFRGLCSADIYPLKPNLERISPDYLFYLLLSRDFTNYAITASNRAGMPKINRTQIFAYKLKLPPLEAQERIALKLNEARETALSLIKEVENTDAQISQLTNAILRKAFAGEL